MGGADEQRLFDDLTTLTEMLGPSGYEDDVQDWLEARWQAAGCRTHRSKVGNLYAHVGGKGPKLLIAAHADEISFRVKSITDDGHLMLTSGTGGSELKPPHTSFVAQPCTVMTGTGNLSGTVGTVTGHVMTKEQRESNRIDWPELFCDIGARGREQALAMGVHVGAPVVAAVPTRRVNRNVVGKAMDDRAALAVMTHLLERVDASSLPYELWFVSTVQEEVGLVGAGSVRDFDLAIALEVGLAGDIPPVGLQHVPVKLGDGPILAHKDGAVHYDRHLTRRLQTCAERLELPLQHLVFLNFASDARAFIANDVPTAMLAYPTRYTHSPIETIDMRDLLGLLTLLEAFVQEAPEA